jgi:hypothetical protein
MPSSVHVPYGACRYDALKEVAIDLSLIDLEESATSAPM